MRRAIQLLIFITTVTLVACGGTETNNPTEPVKKVSLKGLEVLDLTEFGFNLSIMVPKADVNGAAEVTLTERGTLEIVIGVDYGVEIMFGEGDIELLKSDLKEDLVFNTEILKEEKDVLIYTQDIPDSGVKIQNHFMYRAVVGENVYEVKDISAREYGSGMIEKMFESAKTIKASGIEVAV